MTPKVNDEESHRYKPKSLPIPQFLRWTSEYNTVHSAFVTLYICAYVLIRLNNTVISTMKSAIRISRHQIQRDTDKNLNVDCNKERHKYHNLLLIRPGKNINILKQCSKRLLWQPLMNEISKRCNSLHS